MAKPVLQLAAVGVVGVVIWKLAGVFLIPLLFTVLKFALIVAAALFAVWLFKRMDKPKPEEGGDKPAA